MFNKTNRGIFENAVAAVAHNYPRRFLLSVREKVLVIFVVLFLAPLWG